METTMKRCSKCGRELPVENFGIRRDAKDGLNCWCKECAKKSAKSSYDKKMKSKKTSALMNVPVHGDGTSPLSSYTPRELFEELRRRGFKGKLYYTSTVDLELL